MGINERREIEKGEMRKKIIDSATEILANEGYSSLSIRKIASRIEYSPGTIYHYFKDKAEVVTSVAEEFYRMILKKISEVPVDTQNPDKSIRDGLRAYIDLMLEAPEQFKAILMENIPEIQQIVNILEEGISKERKSIGVLCEHIALGIEKGKFRTMDVEATAQILWTATYGLTSRLILERNISEAQKEKLINQHFDILISGLLK
jgi:AcrR family transcriptional regulator